MNSVIFGEKEISSTVLKFKKKIIAFSEKKESLEWAFPSGDKAQCDTYFLRTKLGMLLVAVPEKWPGRQAHLFSLNYEGGILSPDVEINIPDNLDRKVSGAYVKNGKRLSICHRGGFTAFRGKIPKEISMAFFSKWLISTEDYDKNNELISVASLESSSLANDIAEFVSAVSDMKIQFKSGCFEQEGSISLASWDDKDEFEGKKSSGNSSKPKDYEYLHGPLCNSLRRYLKSIVRDKIGLEAFSNNNVDVAIVEEKSNKATVIFEVKTSASLSSQLYSAYGQLSYYKYKYGTPRTDLFLVLPLESKDDLRCESFFISLGVQIIFGEKDKFMSSSGESLKDILCV